MKIVSIKWVDSCSSDHWRVYNTSDLLPTTINSIGYLIQDEKTHVTISHSIEMDGSNISQHAGHLTIPRQAILKINKLKF